MVRNFKQSWKDSAPHNFHHSTQKGVLPSCSSGVSSSASSQDGYDVRCHPNLQRSRNNSVRCGREVTGDHKSYPDFSSNIFKETNFCSKKVQNMKRVPVPLWRKVPHPSSLDVDKRVEVSGAPNSVHINSLQGYEFMCNYHVSMTFVSLIF